MKQHRIFFGLICIFLITGCASLRRPAATVEGRVISNPALGFFGFSFEMPEGFELYNFAAAEPDDELHQLAIRIHDLNRSYHPRGQEAFYDSFLLLAEKSAVLLITLEMDAMPRLGTDPFTDELVPHVESVPLYNISGRETVPLHHNRADAICTRGYAFEQKGWYYANERRNRIRFQYEAYKVSGSNRDRYVLMGLCLPGDEDALRLQMQELAQALRF